MFLFQIQRFATSEHKFKGPVGDTVICLPFHRFFKSLTYREITLCLEKEGERERKLLRERERDRKKGERNAEGENGMEG